MSQVYLGTSSSPSVPTTFVTDDGNATPAANSLNILGNDTTVYNANGISTSGSGDTVTALLTNRLQGTTSTISNVTGDIITFPLGASAGVFLISAKICAFDSATPSGACFKIDIAVRTTGAAATIIDTDLYPQKEAALAATDVTGVLSGNSIIIRVLGQTGLTLSWASTGSYERVL